jgi:GNAT superfamily N-acetyltransferase
MSVEIREVDPADEPELRRWWETKDEAMASRPCPTLNPSWATARVTLPHPHADFRQTLLTAYHGDAVVGCAILVLPVADNLTMSYADVTVPERYRRRGVGTALLDEVEARARQAGRAYVLVEVIAPIGVVGQGELFAEARGYPIANREGSKVLDLHDHPDWSPLDRKVVERAGGYRIETWGNVTPEQYAQPLCEALNTFISMIPSGDVALEDIVMTPERLRRNELRSDALGRRRFVATAFSPDGTLAGNSDLYLPPHVVDHADVGITMVLPEHRGHALGLAMKLATHRALEEAEPACRLVTTNNADANVAMNAVNDALGYRLVEQQLEVQKKLSGRDQILRSRT